MTVSIEDRLVSYTATGATTGPFAVPFPFFEISVYLDSELVDPTDYSVSQDDPGGDGDVTFDVAPTGRVVIVGNTAVSQQIDYISTNSVDPETVERGLDRLTMVAQELKRDTGYNSDWLSNPERLVTADVDGLFTPYVPTDAGYLYVDADGVATNIPATVPPDVPDISLLAEDTANNDETDYLVEYDASASAHKKVLPKNIGYTQTGTGAVRRGLQSRLRDRISVKDFGAVGDGATDDSAAIQAAIDYAGVAGGTIYFPRGSYLANTPLTITASGVTLEGAGPSASSIFATNTDGVILTISGTRCNLRNLLIYRNKRAAADTSVCVKYNNAVQCCMEGCWIQGSYHCVAITGNNCADITFIRSIFLYATGGSQVRAYNTSGSGICGAFHFYRCLFNQEYPLYDTLGVPTSASYSGAWAATTAYTTGKIVSSGGMYWRCKTGGTSGATAVGTVGVSKWYGEDVTDGSCVWRLMGSTEFRGLQLDTGTTYCRVRECDFTGPYNIGMEIANSASGAVPYGMIVEACTAHAPIFYGFAVSAGYQVHFNDLDTYGGTQSGAAGIAISNSDTVSIKGCKITANTYGIVLNSGAATLIGNMISACSSTAILVAAGVSKFVITSNLLGSTPGLSGNGAPVTVSVGASDRYVISQNIINGSGSVSDGGTGTNKSIANNF